MEKKYRVRTAYCKRGVVGVFVTVFRWDVKVQQPSRPDLQNALYNGWLVCWSRERYALLQMGASFGVLTIVQNLGMTRRRPRAFVISS